jgi:hypothetical protein
MLYLIAAPNCHGKSKACRVLTHMTELRETERRIAETHALIERQRRLVEELAHGDNDNVASAHIVFDSLCVSLSLYLRERDRLRNRFAGSAA